MRRLIVLVLAATLVAPLRAQQASAPAQHASATAAKPAAALRLVIAPHVLKELGALADTLRVETVRCLIGAVQGDSAYIDLAWQPAIDASTPNSVLYRSCPVATLALWHNHPQRGEPAPEYACYLSGIDIREALRPHAPPLQFVQVNRDVACWWTRRELSRAAQLAVLFPRPGNLWGDPVKLTAAACSGALRGIAACVLLHACEPSASGGAPAGAVQGRRERVATEGGWWETVAEPGVCPAPLELAGPTASR